jgi:O-antigen ligase
LGITVPLVFVTGTFQRITQIFYIYDLSALNRISLLEEALYLFKKSPIIGVGFGRYNDILYWGLEPVPLSGKPGLAALYTAQNYIFNNTNAHNSYLHFLAENGIIGLMLILAFWLLCFVLLIQAYRKTTDIFAKKIYLCASGGIITLFALAVTENYMTAPTVMLCLSVVVSLAIGLSGRERSKGFIR